MRERAVTVRWPFRGILLVIASCGTTITVPEIEPEIIGIVSHVGARPDAEGPTIRVDREPGDECGLILGGLDDPGALVVRRLADQSLERMNWHEVRVGDSVRAWGRLFHQDSCPAKTALGVLEVIE